MRMHKVPVLLAALLVFLGCQLPPELPVAPPVDPIVGTWASTHNLYIFAADGVFNLVHPLEGGTATEVGTYMCFDNRLRIQWSDGSLTGAFYEINGDTMILRQYAEVGPILTLLRQ